MYNAPAVTYPVGRSHIKRVITGALLLLALGVLGFWCQQVPRLAWPQGLGLGLWLLGVLLAIHDDLRPPSGKLCWDGQSWRWEAGGQTSLVDVRPQLDGQRFVVLALRSSQGLVWLWLEREMDVLHWDALRRAVWAQDKIGAVPKGRHQGMGAEQP